MKTSFLLALIIVFALSAKTQNIIENLYLRNQKLLKRLDLPNFIIMQCLYIS